MRKYLIAALTGLILLGGQAVASENAIGGMDDRVGGPADARFGAAVPHGELLVLLFGAGITGLLVWGLSEHGHHGAPASP
jgi:hypothetical protein